MTINTNCFSPAADAQLAAASAGVPQTATFAGLPHPSSVQYGTPYIVTDGHVMDAVGAILLSGGGSIPVKTFSDGSHWRVG